MLTSHRPTHDSLKNAESSGPLDRTWIVIAAYHEASRLGKTLTDVCSLYRNVVVVDDGSSDATVAVALQFPVWVVQHTVNCGQGAALQTGLDFALQQGADVLVTFDADGQHSANEIDRLATPVAGGKYDVALGSRFLGKSCQLPWSRWFVLKLGVLFTRIVSGIRVSDTHNGFRALSRNAAQKIRLQQNRMSHASELLDKIQTHRLSFSEVPVTIGYSSETLSKGQSSWNAVPIIFRFLLDRLVK